MIEWIIGFVCGAVLAFFIGVYAELVHLSKYMCSKCLERIGKGETIEEHCKKR